MDSHSAVQRLNNQDQGWIQWSVYKLKGNSTSEVVVMKFGNNSYAKKLKV